MIFDLSIYITNLALYNAGYLVGKWVSLPISCKDFQRVLKEIKIDAYHEEYFITDYDCDIARLTRNFSEYESVAELNDLATKLEELDIDESDFEDILELACVSSVEDVIELCDSIDNYTVIHDVRNVYDLGYYYVEEAGIYDTEKMGTLSSYIDYEKFGRDIRIEECGIFTKNGSYVYENL